MDGATRRFGLALPALLVLTVGLLAPLAVILAYSFLSPGPYGGVSWPPTLDAYRGLLWDRDIFDDSLVFTTAYLEIFGRSLLFAAIITALALLVGFPIAYTIALQPPRRRLWLLLLVTVPYWVNLLVRTLALLFLLRDEGPLNAVLVGSGAADGPLTLAYTRGAVILGLVYSYLPFVVLPIYAALERSDPRLTEAAFDLYASRGEVLRHVVIPLARPGIVAGCLLVFIPSVGSFLAPQVLGGGRELFAGNLIAQQFGASRNWPLGSAAAVVLMLVVLAGLLLFLRQQARLGEAPTR